MQFSRVAILTNFNIPDKAEAAREAARVFAAHGASLLLDLSVRGRSGFESAGLPVRYIGLGEQMDDMQPFDARQFVDAIF